MANYSSDKFQIIGCNNLDSEGILRPSLTYWQDAWRRLRKNKVAIISLIALVLMIIMSIVGPMIANFQYQSMNKGMENLAPNSTFWFGTDVVGRDLFFKSMGWWKNFYLHRNYWSDM